MSRAAAAIQLRIQIARRMDALGVRRDDLLRDADISELSTLDEVYRAEVVHLWDYTDYLLLLMAEQGAQLEAMAVRLEKVEKVDKG